MGLFKPAWQHMSKEKALAATASETNQKKLIVIAKKASIPDVRKVAVKKLTVNADAATGTFSLVDSSSNESIAYKAS